MSCNGYFQYSLHYEFVYLSVLRVFGWVALLARSNRTKDAGILILRIRSPCSNASSRPLGCHGQTRPSRAGPGYCPPAISVSRA